jgi:hypothetical protein
MSDPRPQAGITRRALLGGLAGAGAAGLLGPLPAIAANRSAPSRTFSVALGDIGAGRTRAIVAPHPFELAGVEWSSPCDARIELRARAASGSWGPWAPASALGHDPDQPRQLRRTIGDPVWTGAADLLELRTAAPVHGVRVHLVRAERFVAQSAALSMAEPLLDAGPGQPPIIARKSWARGMAPPSQAAGYGTIRLAFVHHTQTPNGYGRAEVPAIIRGIFDYHRYVRGFHDIAYNFLIDHFGRVWEGRGGGIDEAVVGAQAGGYNLESTGVAVIGSFQATPPPPAALRALEHLLAWKLSLHGVPATGRVSVVVNPHDAFYTPFPPGAHVSLPRIAGHRDGDSTDCPGDAFYRRLPRVRARATALAGNPAKLLLIGPSAPVGAGTPLALSGRLAYLDGTPIAGAPIELQQRLPARETTLITATTGADGSFAATVALSANARLRALHRPRPAAVADLVAVAVAPALTLAVASLAPLTVNGTISPPKPKVTIDLYALVGEVQTLVRRVSATVGAGSFTTAIAPPGPGQYVLIAHSAADALNAVGSSPPLQVSIS